MSFDEQPDPTEAEIAAERLYQAAPDLLAALKDILQDDDGGTSLADQRARWPARMKAAFAAVAKAEPDWTP